MSSSAQRAARGTLTGWAVRLVSFLGTQVLLKRTNPLVLGQTSVQYELQHRTALTLLHGFRLTTVERENEQWMLGVYSLMTNVCICSIWALCIYAYDQEAVLYLYCLAALIEGSAEPAVLWLQRQLQISVKASAEGLATLFKTLVTLVLLEKDAYAFGVAQCVYSLVYASILYAAVYKELHFRYVPHMQPTLVLAACYTAQACFKHVLTEADRIVLSSLDDDHYHQGLYALGAAYGGLAARLVLQPLEEAARLYWTQQASVISYTSLVKLVTYFGAILALVCVNYTETLLLLLGPAWSHGNAQASAVVAAHCVYTATLAWNGMTEAFVYARLVDSGPALARLSVAHTIVALLLLGMAPVALQRYSVVGLVASNGVGMLMRSVYSIYLTVQYFQVAPVTLLSRMLPHPVSCAVLVGAYFVTGWSLQNFGMLAHVAVGAVMGITILGTAWMVEGEWKGNLQRLWRSKDSKDEEKKKDK